MTIYKPKGRREYRYDFIRGRRRYAGTTHCTNRREALQFERRLKCEVEHALMLERRQDWHSHIARGRPVG